MSILSSIYQFSFRNNSLTYNNYFKCALVITECIELQECCTVDPGHAGLTAKLVSQNSELAGNKDLTQGHVGKFVCLLTVIIKPPFLRILQ